MPYPTWLPILLGILTAVGPLSTDMYLPAFPAIEASMHGMPGTAQVTLATWFAGLAVGQVTQGSLADRFGRRRPLIVGTLVYALANVGCALSTDITTLSVLRFVAAFGGSASMVIPRAIVRDLTDGHAAARLMSRLILVMGAAPILAPTLGGAVLGFGSWHAIFWIMSVYGALCAVLVVALLPETLAARHRITGGVARTLARFDASVRRGLDRFSWFIYRMNQPALRDLFMNPRNVLRFQEAMLSILSGDVFRPSPVHGRLVLFKALYYAKALGMRFGRDRRVSEA